MKHSISIIRTAVGVLGNIFSFFLFFSPAPTFYRICKNKSVEEFHPYPYLAASMNCVFWVFYGLPFIHPHSTLVVTINSVGLFLELCYVFVFMYFTDTKQRLRILGILLAECAVFGTVAGITIPVFHTHHSRSLFVGVVCVIFGIMLYGSPLSVMSKVIKTKSVEFMPFWLSLASFCNGIVWAIYALLGIFDPFILTGNGIGAILGAVQLGLYFKYRKTTPKKGDMEKGGKPSDVQLQSRTSS